MLKNLLSFEELIKVVLFFKNIYVFYVSQNMPLTPLFLKYPCALISCDEEPE